MNRQDRNLYGRCSGGFLTQLKGTVIMVALPELNQNNARFCFDQTMTVVPIDSPLSGTDPGPVMRTTLICKNFEIDHEIWKMFLKLTVNFNVIYPMPEISDFQRTNSEFAKSEQRYPVKITLEYAH
jgi:hypothetical protein